jgi:hypothetical protein
LRLPSLISSPAKEIAAPLRTRERLCSSLRKNGRRGGGRCKRSGGEKGAGERAGRRMGGGRGAEKRGERIAHSET